MMGALPNCIFQINDFFFGKFLQCGCETNWKILISFWFFYCKFKKNKKLGNFSKVLITQNWPPKKNQTLAPNPTLVMNKLLVT